MTKVTKVSKANSPPITKALVPLCVFITLCLSLPTPLSAQTCQKCDHTIDVKTTYVDASKLNPPIQPGQTICFKAGKKDFLNLENFKGSASKPLTFLNCGGQVLIQNSPRGYGFVINNSQHFKLTGTGDSSVKYGFKVDGTRQGASGLVLGERSSNFDVSYVEVMRTGFAGIIAKTDPNCSRPDMRSFVMKDVHFHHTYLHDTGGEGFYIGYFAYPTRTVKCNNKDTTLYPHRIEGVSIHHNLLKNNGWDAIQLGSAPKQAAIYNNVVENYATAKEQFQQSGIQLNAGAAADVYNNILIKGTGPGLAIFGYGGSKVYNNLIVDAAEDGIYVNDKTAQTKTPYVIANNTIVRPGRYGVGLAVSNTKNNIAANNLVVAPGAFAQSGDKAYIATITNKANYKISGNLHVKTLAAAGFQDPSKDDYHLKKGSGAVDKGVSVAAQGITKDLDGKPRAVGPTDVGAYEFQGAPQCNDGEMRACQVGGQAGQERCSQGQWGPCQALATEPTKGSEDTPDGGGNPEPPRPDTSKATEPAPDSSATTEPPATPDALVGPEPAPEPSPVMDSQALDAPTSTPDSPGPQTEGAGPSGGCSCQQRGTPGLLWLVLLLLLGAAKRRPKGFGKI